MVVVRPLTPASLSTVEAPGGASGVPGASLSIHFGPFLRGLARQSLLVGGSVVVAEEEGVPVGLRLTDPEEHAASIFTRSRAALEALRPGTERLSTFTEIEVGGPCDEYVVYAGATERAADYRFRHRLRLLADRDRDPVAGLLHEVYGYAPRRWLSIAGAEGEIGVVAEADGRPVGVAWVMVAGAAARLHGLTVRPSHRRLGIARDLVAARLLYAQRAGAERAVAEIAHGNVPSRAAAERLGLREDGRLFQYVPPKPPEAGAAPPGAGAPSVTFA